MTPVLVVITGATASGKSSLAVALARRLGCDIISADSRQVYREIPIGTAAPSAADLAAVRHHFVGTLSLTDYYSAARFEADVMALLPGLFAENPVQVMCGGSMMYVDAVTDGIDPLPDISPEVRQRVADLDRDHGLPGMLALLDNLDPEYGAVVDRANTRRVAHALEIILASGVTYTSLRRRAGAERPFRIVKVAIDLPRPLLYERINARVDRMVADGLVDEARRVCHLRNLNALNTVGYKEMFAYFDGQMSLPEAVARIAKNTRTYARKQLTWLARPTVRPAVMLPPDSALDAVQSLIDLK